MEATFKWRLEAVLREVYQHYRWRQEFVEERKLSETEQEKTICTSRQGRTESVTPQNLASNN